MPLMTPISPPSRAGEPYTEDEILDAIALRKKPRMTWKKIGEKLGRSPASLISQVYRYQRGMLTFSRSRRSALMDEIAQEIIAGTSLSEAARRRGLFKQAVHASLKLRGWDQETIQEMRGEIKL